MAAIVQCRSRYRNERRARTHVRPTRAGQGRSQSVRRIDLVEKAVGRDATFPENRRNGGRATSPVKAADTRKYQHELGKIAAS